MWEGPKLQGEGGMEGDTLNIDKVGLVGHNYRNSSGEFLEKRKKIQPNVLIAINDIITWSDDSEV